MALVEVSGAWTNIASNNVCHDFFKEKLVKAEKVVDGGAYLAN